MVTNSTTSINHKMAAREPSRFLSRALPRASVPSIRPQGFLSRRNVSDEAPSRRLSDHMSELETASSLSTPVPDSAAQSFDPVARAKARKTQLPRGR
jgi:large subunit ribosomal protein L5